MAVQQPSPHSEHDVLLVAAAASGDLDGPELNRALDQTQTCAECADLLSDLRAIASATAALPAARRTRDFRLTEADAARLRPRGWRRLVRAFAEPRFGF